MPVSNLTPMSELNEQIRRGWGDTPGEQIPKNWRTTTPKKTRPKYTRSKYKPVEHDKRDPAQKQLALDKHAARMRDRRGSKRRALKRKNLTAWANQHKMDAPSLSVGNIAKVTA